MAEQLEQLVPIADIVGPTGVSATYSDSEIWDSNRGVYRPGWKIEINATYKGAKIRLSESRIDLNEAAAAALDHLRRALGLN